MLQHFINQRLACTLNQYSYEECMPEAQDGLCGILLFPSSPRSVLYSRKAPASAFVTTSYRRRRLVRRRRVILLPLACLALLRLVVLRLADEPNHTHALCPKSSPSAS